MKLHEIQDNDILVVRLSASHAPKQSEIGEAIESAFARAGLTVFALVVTGNVEFELIRRRDLAEPLEGIREASLPDQAACTMTAWTLWVVNRAHCEADAQCGASVFRGGCGSERMGQQIVRRGGGRAMNLADDITRLRHQSANCSECGGEGVIYSRWLHPNDPDNGEDCPDCAFRGEEIDRLLQCANDAEMAQLNGEVAA